MSRERKPSVLFGSEVVPDHEIQKAIREYNKKKAPKKKPEVKAEKQKEVVEVKPTAPHKVGKAAHGSRGKAAHPPVLSPQARLQEEIEERHIAKCRERNSRSARPRKQLPEGAVELPNLETAIKRGVKESSTTLLDWSSPKAKMIGFTCKVYWDGEDTWFYARILNYDSFYDRHYIYYIEDSTAEWINLEDEIVLVAEEMVLARLNPGGAPWAAQRFWISTRAMHVCHNFPGFHKGGDYVEYLSEQKNKEYAFLQRKCLDPMQDKFMPSKQSAAFKRSMKAAEHEQEAIDGVIEAVQSAMRDSVFAALHDEQWVGHRVRASTHRIVQRGESRSEVLELGCAYSLGTIQCYRPGTGEHLVVFDDPLLQPQWVVCQKSTVDVLFEAGEAGQTDGANAMRDRSRPRLPPGAAEGDYSAQCECVLCDGALVAGSFKECEECGMKCHSYCAGEEASSKGPTAGSSAQQWGASAAVPWTCWNCVVCFGCSARSWDKSLLAWNAQRVEPEGPDLDMQVCGDCLYRYKHVRDFCPSCFKPYATDESMLPLLGATLIVPPAGADGAVAVLSTNLPAQDGVTVSEDAEGGDTAVLMAVEEADVDEEEKGEADGSVDGTADENDSGSTAEDGEKNGEAEEMELETAPAPVLCVPISQPIAPPDLSEDNMVECNECARWVHASCEGIDKAQYDAMTLGTHPIWGDEYLCPLCRVKLSRALIRKLGDQDKIGMFAEPVTERVARNYFDVIRNPMDMSTMSSKASRGLYKSLQALRQDFELMCLNAVVFNTAGDEYWREARRFYDEVQRVFNYQKRKTHGSAFGAELQQAVDAYEAQQEAEKAAKCKKRKAAASAAGAEEDGTGGKRWKTTATDRSDTASAISDLPGENSVLGSENVPAGEFSHGGASHSSSSDKLNQAAAASGSALAEPEIDLDDQIFLPDRLSANPDPSSYLPCTVVSQSIEEAYHLMCQDCCLVCGSSGRPELMLFCVDCGEAVHSFCSDAPLSMMPEEARAGWRCMNCKICKCCRSATENDTLGKLLYCDGCDHAFHANCVLPKVPITPDGSWYCSGCVKCVTCVRIADPLEVGDSAPRCWGFDLSACIRCRWVQEHRRKEEELLARQKMLLEMQRNAPSNCNICFEACTTPPYVMCSGCGRNSHVTCNLPNTTPMLRNDTENSCDFLCMRCVTEYMPSCSSHIGSGTIAADVLQSVARIQRLRNSLRIKVKGRQLENLEEERRRTFENSRPLLRSVVAWATLRSRWFLTFQGALPSIATVHPKVHSNFLSARAVRFLALWKRVAGTSVGARNQRRDHMLRGLGEDGREMSAERLVRVAALAASFLDTTDTEVRKYLAKEIELAPVVAFAQSLLAGSREQQSADSAAQSSAVAVTVTIETIDAMIEKLNRPPIGFDTEQLPTQFCTGISLFAPKQRLHQHNQNVLHGGAAVVPWMPGNVLRNQLLSNASHPPISYFLVVPEGGSAAAEPSAVASTAASQARSLAETLARPAADRNKQGDRSSKPMYDQATIDSINGTGFYARKARLVSLVPNTPVLPPTATVSSLLERPDVKLVAHALELATQTLTTTDQPEKEQIAEARRTRQEVAAALDDVIAGVEQRSGVTSGRKGRTMAHAKTALGQDVRAPNVQAKLAEIADLLVRTSAGSGAAQCYECVSFDPSAYQFAASPVTPLQGQRMSSTCQDPRFCCLCLDSKEDNIVGRLLPNFDGMHVHTNCLRWSPDVVETDGTLKKAIDARDRALRTTCFYCSRKGATVCCTNRKKCRRAFHVRCALICKCAMMEVVPSGTVTEGTTGHEIRCLALCPEHIPTCRENPQLVHLWQPNDPVRSCLIDDNQDAHFTAELLSQRRSDKAVRSGTLTILGIGKPLPKNPDFHSEHYIYPHRFRSARIYWSMVKPLERTLYAFEVFLESDLDGLDAAQSEYVRRSLQRSDRATGASVSSTQAAGRGHNAAEPDRDRPVFRVVAMDDASQPIFSYSVVHAFQTVVERVHACNREHAAFSAKGPTNSAATGSYGFSPHQFFGLSAPFVRKAIELFPESLSLMISLDKEEPKVLYSPVYRLPTKHDAFNIQQQELRSQDGLLASINGCSRADGYGQHEKRAGGKRVTRILTKVADADGGGAGNGKPELNKYEQKEDEEENKRVNEALRTRYQEMTAAYLENPYAKLDVRKSGIHGWGLFAKINFERNDIIVEYIGQKIRQVVADRREVQYEDEGVGSCYLFRLDKDDIIDATRRGGMARFMNHCCEPNAYARVISAPAPGLDSPDEKHIIIIAARDIQEGEEVTYDYKFPIEDSKLKCYCGAACCGGFMN